MVGFRSISIKPEKGSPVIRGVSRGLEILGSDCGGFFDAFVVKLNPSGSALVYSTYLGGTG
jgi:hypothetical protein